MLWYSIEIWWNHVSEHKNDKSSILRTSCLIFCAMAPYFDYLCCELVIVDVMLKYYQRQMPLVSRLRYDVIRMTSGLAAVTSSCTLSGVSFDDPPKLNRPHRISLRARYFSCVVSMRSIVPGGTAVVCSTASVMDHAK